MITIEKIISKFLQTHPLANTEIIKKAYILLKKLMMDKNALMAILD